MSTQPKLPVVPSALLLVVLMALGGLAQPAAADHNVNGWSLTWVQAGQGGSKVSVYRKIGDKLWQEVPSSSGGGIYSFEETSRDAASVYLRDSSRGVDLHIDLAAGKVRYRDANSSWRDLYDVLGTSAQASGWNVRHVSYGQGGRTSGEYCQTGHKAWREIGDNTYNFNEVERDDFSVFLNDPSRNVDIQIDLKAGKVRYRDADSSWRELYDVLSASAQANGWLVQLVSYSQGGRTSGEYRQTGDRTWKEISFSSGNPYNFNETGRDETSVYLHDPSRNVDIHIDLEAGKVYYRDANSSWRELYDVEGVSM